MRPLVLRTLWMTPRRRRAVRASSDACSAADLVPRRRRCSDANRARARRSSASRLLKPPRPACHSSLRRSSSPNEVCCATSMRGVFVATSVPDSLCGSASRRGAGDAAHAVVVDRTAAWHPWGGCAAPQRDPRDAIRLNRLQPQRAAGCDTPACAAASRAPDVGRGHRGAGGVARDDVVLRTACDLGRPLWRYDALAAIDGLPARSALGHGSSCREVDRFKGHRGARSAARAGRRCGDPGAESPPESALRLHWHEADMPSRPDDPDLGALHDRRHTEFRIDVGDPEVRFGAEYFGEEFHGERRRASTSDAPRVARTERELGHGGVHQVGRLRP